MASLHQRDAKVRQLNRAYFSAVQNMTRRIESGDSSYSEIRDVRDNLARWQASLAEYSDASNRAKSSIYNVDAATLGVLMGSVREAHHILVEEYGALLQTTRFRRSPAAPPPQRPSVSDVF